MVDRPSGFSLRWSLHEDLGDAAYRRTSPAAPADGEPGRGPPAAAPTRPVTGREPAPRAARRAHRGSGARRRRGAVEAARRGEGLSRVRPADTGAGRGA